MTTDEAGAVEQTLDYYPFGNVRIDTGGKDFDEKRKFTGHLYDEESDFSYMGARYQSPSIGRFLSQDPVSLSLGNRALLESKTELDLEDYLKLPQTHNSYAYAANNPIKFIDKNGEWLDIVVDVGFAVYSGYKLGQAIASGDGDAIQSESVNFSLDAGGALIPGVVGVGSLRRTAQIAGDAGKLILSEGRYRHIVDRHTLDGKQFIEGKTSYFNHNVDIRSLIDNASKQPGKLNDSGYYERVIDTGKNIGVDRATGKQTTTYTVISDRKGNVITSHPGQPRRPRQR